MEKFTRPKAGEPVSYDARTGDQFIVGGIKYRVSDTFPDGLKARAIGPTGYPARDAEVCDFTYPSLSRLEAIYMDYEMRPCGAPGAEAYVPGHTFSALEAYIFRGVGPSDFLYAVLTNNLKEAVAHADSENRKALVDIVVYLYNRAPSTAWGSPAAVKAWIDNKDGIRERSVRTFYA